MYEYCNIVERKSDSIDSNLMSASHDYSFPSMRVDYLGHFLEINPPSATRREIYEIADVPIRNLFSVKCPKEKVFNLSTLIISSVMQDEISKLNVLNLHIDECMKKKAVEMNFWLNERIRVSALMNESMLEDKVVEFTVSLRGRLLMVDTLPISDFVAALSRIQKRLG